MAGPIIIIGAGVSGLALAQGLFKHGIPFQLFERDSSLTARPQGYRFRISDEGIDALQQNLTTSQFLKLKNGCSVLQSTSNTPSPVLDAMTGEFAEPIFPPGQRPREMETKLPPLSADRTVLRTILMEGIEEHVVFGKAFESYSEQHDSVVVKFTDGSEAQGCLLIGADGTRSRLRRQLLPHFSLLDTEGRLIFGKTDMTNELLSAFSPQATNGLTLIRKPGLACLLEAMRFPSQLPKDYVYWVLFMRPEDLEGLDDAKLNSSTSMRSFAQKMTSDWHKSFRPLFEKANDDQTALYKVLSAHPAVSMAGKVATSGRVTLIGDAIHPMAPTAALGATTALRDAGLLVKLLNQHGMSKIKLVTDEYEAEMAKYASATIKATVMGGKAMFGMRPFDELKAVEL